MLYALYINTHFDLQAMLLLLGYSLLLLQVVYVREGVAVWPTKNQRIMGRLSLIKQHQVMFLAWLPYSQGSLNSDGTFFSSATAEKSATQSAKGLSLTGHQLACFAPLCTSCASCFALKLPPSSATTLT